MMINRPAASAASSPVSNTHSISDPHLFISKKPRLWSSDAQPSPDFMYRQGKGERILIIDDEVSIADSLAEILCNHGYNALAFYDGHDAIAAARERCPEMVICDVIMPRLNGIDTVMAIREICPGARILLFSGQAGTTDIMKRARENGHSFELLPKPIHPNELLRRLRTKTS